jgi:hypothetical protein
MSRRILLDELAKPDGLGRHVHRLFLGHWNREQMAFEPSECLGEFVADPGVPVGVHEWIGTHPDTILRITLPDSRVVEVQGAVHTVAWGFAAVYPASPKRAEKARPRKAKAAPPEAQSTLF